MTGWFAGSTVLGRTRTRSWLLALGVALGCTPARTPDSPSATNDSQQPLATSPSVGARGALPVCTTSPCVTPGAQPSPREHAATPLPPYEPERFEPAAELSAEDALRLLGAFAHSSAPGEAACARLQAPIARTCEATGPEMLALVAHPPKYRPFKAAFEETRKLTKVEGCTVLPAGAMRWIRARRLSQCAPELATSALAQGGPDLEPKMRGLLLGEAIAGQCLRRVEPMPPFRGKFTPERFARWRTLRLVPWHDRSLKRLDECHDAATSIPVGVPGRASAMIGYAQAVAKFVVSHRAAPMDKVLVQDYEARVAYLAAIDDITAPFAVRRDAATEEARRQAAREGAYEDYVRAFEPLVPRQEPLSILDLPPLPPMTEAPGEWMLSRLPVQIALFAPNTLMGGTGDAPAATRSLAALLRRGLPLEIRARLGAALTQMLVTDPARQHLHLLLAAGLLRLGLVTQDRTVVERAAYELRYAGTGAHQSWLAALTRAILTPGMEQALFPEFAPSAAANERKEPDLSGFTPALIELSVSHPEHADIAVDRAILGSGGPTSEHYLRFGNEAVVLAKRAGVSPALVGCVNHHFGLCYSDFVGGTRQGSCACTPFPWRVE